MLASLLALIVGLIAYRTWRPRPVMVEPVARGQAVEAIYATGTVEPIQNVIVKARLGEHVASIEAREGQLVVKGQVLARIENPVRELAVSQGEVQLAKARKLAATSSPQLAALDAQVSALRTQLALANTELARTQKLFATDAVTRQELDVARTRVEQLTAQTRAADEQLRTTRLELGASVAQLESQVKSLASEANESVVVSPIDGLILRRSVEIGEVVAPNQEMFEIADTSVLLIELEVDEADIARVRDEAANASTVALSFFAFPGKAFQGTVTAILPDPDRQRRSYTVKVRLDEPTAGLRVGMTTEANIVVSRKDGVLLIPTEAVQGDLAWFVEGGRAVQRRVQLGIRDLTHVELVSGAAEGALAIVDTGGKTLSPGQRVSAKARHSP